MTFDPSPTVAVPRELLERVIRLYRRMTNRCDVSRSDAWSAIEALEAAIQPLPATPPSCTEGPGLMGCVADVRGGCYRVPGCRNMPKDRERYCWSHLPHNQPPVTPHHGIPSGGAVVETGRG